MTITDSLEEFTIQTKRSQLLNLCLKIVVNIHPHKIYNNELIVSSHLKAVTQIDDMSLNTSVLFKALILYS